MSLINRKIPFTDIDTADYKDTPSVARVVSVVNDFMRKVSNLLDGKLSIAENCSAKVYDVTITVPPVSNTTYNPYPISLLWDRQGSLPVGCIIIHARTLDGTAGILGSPFPDVTFQGSRVIINSVVANLTAGKSYLFRFLVIGS